jgi:hypothetical protein
VVVAGAAVTVVVAEAEAEAAISSVLLHNNVHSLSARLHLQLRRTTLVKVRSPMAWMVMTSRFDQL